MDGSFACPECGSSVEVGGLAPGRQVRCGFCDRLLEVPFLPRAADAPWKRRRFGRPKWLNWAWAALAIASIVDPGGRVVPVRQATIRLRAAAIDQPSPRVLSKPRGRRPSRPGLDRSRHRTRDGAQSRPCVHEPAWVTGGSDVATLPCATHELALDRLRAMAPFVLGRAPG